MATTTGPDHRTQARGLGMAWNSPRTRGAGLTLGRGQGYLARKHGLTVDTLRGADVVTAVSDLVHTCATENQDLLAGHGDAFSGTTAAVHQRLQRAPGDDADQGQRVHDETCLSVPATGNYV